MDSLTNDSVGSLPTSEMVWNGVVRIIASLRIPQGGKLPSVRELAAQLGQKPTVVRDALLHAQARGLVRVVPRAGAFLQMTSTAAHALTGGLMPVLPQAFGAATESSLENVLNLLDARRLIEVELVGRAAVRRRIEDLLPIRRVLDEMFQLETDASRAKYVDRDIRFHVLIGRLAGNEVLARMQETLLELLRPFLTNIPSPLQRRSIADQSHTAIYAALVDENAQEAKHVMQRHLNLAYDSLLGEIRKLPEPLAKSKARS